MDFNCPDMDLDDSIRSTTYLLVVANNSTHLPSEYDLNYNLIIVDQMSMNESSRTLIISSLVGPSDIFAQAPYSSSSAPCLGKFP